MTAFIVFSFFKTFPPGGAGVSGSRMLPGCTSGWEPMWSITYSEREGKGSWEALQGRNVGCQLNI